MLASGFAVSSNLDYEGYHKNTDEMPPPQGPIRYGPHPNVEIAFVIITADNVLHMLLELQFKCSVTGEGVSQAVEDKVSQNRAGCKFVTRWCDVSGFMGFFSPVATNFNRTRYFHTCFFTGIQTEICDEGSLVYVR